MQCNVVICQVHIKTYFYTCTVRLNWTTARSDIDSYNNNHNNNNVFVFGFFIFSFAIFWFYLFTLGKNTNRCMNLYLSIKR